MARCGISVLYGGVNLSRVRVLRWFMLALVLFGLGMGFNRGWLQLRWGLMMRDIGFPFVCDPDDPTRCYPKGTPYAQEAAEKQAR